MPKVLLKIKFLGRGVTFKTPTDNSSSGFSRVDEELSPVFFETRVVRDGDVHVVEDVVRVRLAVVLGDDARVLRSRLKMRQCHDAS
jgi:hypothetical protein